MTVAALVLGERLPRTRTGSPATAVASQCGAAPSRCGPAGRVDHRGQGALELGEVLLELRLAVGLGQRLDVEPYGGQRGPQPVGQVGHRLALGGEQLVDPAGQPVEGGADPAYLLGALVRAPAR